MNRLQVFTGLVAVGLVAVLVVMFVVPSRTPVVPATAPDALPPSIATPPPPSAPVQPDQPPDSHATSAGSSATPDDFARLFSGNRVMGDAQRRLEQEARDENWAGAMETRWSDTFEANAELMTYGKPIVECRTSICQVRLWTEVPSTLTTPQWVALLSQGAAERVFDEKDLLISGLKRSSSASTSSEGATLVVYQMEMAR